MAKRPVTLDAELYKLIVDTLSTLLDERDDRGYLDLTPRAFCSQCTGMPIKPPFEPAPCLYHTARAILGAARRRRWPKRWPR